MFIYSLIVSMTVTYTTKTLQKALANQQVAEKRTGLPMKLPIMAAAFIGDCPRTDCFSPGQSTFTVKPHWRLVRGVHSGRANAGVCEVMR